MIRLEIEYKRSVFDSLPNDAFKVCELMQLAGYKAKKWDVQNYNGELSFRRNLDGKLQFHLMVDLTKNFKVGFHIDRSIHRSASLNQETLRLRAEEIERTIKTLSLLSNSEFKDKLVTSLKDELFFGTGRSVSYIEDKNGYKIDRLNIRNLKEDGRIFKKSGSKVRLEKQKYKMDMSA